MIQRACARIENLIDDLLDTARIREGRFKVDMRSELIDEVVTEAVELQRPLADEQAIALERNCALPGVRVLCDRDRLLQVFGNLIGNALKFSTAGGSITVACDRDDDFVRVGVSDTGPGIEAELLPKLFEPYWSGPEHVKHGSGLGLFIVRGIVERHGGRVWVESEPGHGATFFFMLPVEK
jgi:signal transduction histidine kinase